MCTSVSSLRYLCKYFAKCANGARVVVVRRARVVGVAGVRGSRVAKSFGAWSPTLSVNGKLTVWVGPPIVRGSLWKLEVNFEDAMATVRVFGVPSLFITFNACANALQVVDAVLAGPGVAGGLRELNNFVALSLLSLRRRGCKSYGVWFAAGARVRALASCGIAATLLPEPVMTVRGMRVPPRPVGANTRLATSPAVAGETLFVDEVEEYICDRRVVGVPLRALHLLSCVGLPVAVRVVGFSSLRLPVAGSSGSMRAALVEHFVPDAT